MVFRWRALRARDSSANILVTHPEWSECMNIIMTIYSTTLVSVVVFLENTHRPCPFYFYSQFDGECYEDVAVKRVSYGSFSTQMNILNWDYRKLVNMQTILRAPVRVLNFEITSRCDLKLIVEFKVVWRAGNAMNMLPLNEYFGGLSTQIKKCL